MTNVQTHISTDTAQELKEALFPNTKGMGMAEHATRFIISQADNNQGRDCDIATLRAFLIFLKEKNYN